MLKDFNLRERNISNMHIAIGMLLGAAFTCIIVGINNRTFFYVVMPVFTLFWILLFAASYLKVNKIDAV